MKTIREENDHCHDDDDCDNQNVDNTNVFHGELWPFNTTSDDDDDDLTLFDDDDLACYVEDSFDEDFNETFVGYEDDDYNNNEDNVSKVVSNGSHHQPKEHEKDFQLDRNVDSLQVFVRLLPTNSINVHVDDNNESVCVKQNPQQHKEPKQQQQQYRNVVDVYKTSTHHQPQRHVHHSVGRHEGDDTISSQRNNLVVSENIDNHLYPIYDNVIAVTEHPVWEEWEFECHGIVDERQPPSTNLEVDDNDNTHLQNQVFSFSCQRQPQHKLYRMISSPSTSFCNNNNIPQRLLNGYNCNILFYGPSQSLPDNVLFGSSNDNGNKTFPTGTHKNDESRPNGIDSSEYEGDSSNVVQALIHDLFDQLLLGDAVHEKRRTVASVSNDCTSTCIVDDDENDCPGEDIQNEVIIRCSVMDLCTESDHFFDLLHESNRSIRCSIRHSSHRFSQQQQQQHLHRNYEIVGASKVSCVSANDVLSIIQSAKKRQEHIILARQTTSLSKSSESTSQQMSNPVTMNGVLSRSTSSSESTLIVQLHIEQTKKTVVRRNLKGKRKPSTTNISQIDSDSDTTNVQLLYSTLTIYDLHTNIGTPSLGVSNSLKPIQELIGRDLLHNTSLKQVKEQQAIENGSQSLTQNQHGSKSIVPDALPTITKLLASSIFCSVAEKDTGDLGSCYTTIILTSHTTYNTLQEIISTFEFGNDCIQLYKRSTLIENNNSSKSPSIGNEGFKGRENDSNTKSLLHQQRPQRKRPSPAPNIIEWNDFLSCNYSNLDRTYPTMLFRDDTMHSSMFRMLQTRTIMQQQNKARTNQILVSLVKECVTLRRCREENAIDKEAACEKDDQNASLISQDRQGLWSLIDKIYQRYCTAMDGVNNCSYTTDKMDLNRATPTTDLIRDMKLHICVDHNCRILNRKKTMKARIDKILRSNKHLQSELNLANEKINTLMEQNKKYQLEDMPELYKECNKVQNENNELYNRIGIVERQLHISQFRESESIVYMRQLRRFYYRLLRSTVGDGGTGVNESSNKESEVLQINGSDSNERKKDIDTSSFDTNIRQFPGKTISMIIEEIIQRVPGAPNLSQLIDLDRFMQESGLLDRIEAKRKDLSTEAATKKSASKKLLEQSGQQLDKLLAEENSLKDMTNSQQEHLLQRNSVPMMLYPISPPSDSSIEFSRGENDQIVEARQRLYYTPAGRYVEMREQILEQELLQLSDTCKQLKGQLESERASNSLLHNEVAQNAQLSESENSNTIQHHNDVDKLQRLLEQSKNDLKAVLWKMNELHTIVKTAKASIEKRDARIVMLEQYINDDLQKRIDTMARQKQERDAQLEKQIAIMRKEFESRSAISEPVCPSLSTDDVPTNHSLSAMTREQRQTHGIELCPLSHRMVIPLQARSRNTQYNNMTMSYCRDWMEDLDVCLSKQSSNASTQTDSIRCCEQKIYVPSSVKGAIPCDETLLKPTAVPLVAGQVSSDMEIDTAQERVFNDEISEENQNMSSPPTDTSPVVVENTLLTQTYGESTTSHPVAKNHGNDMDVVPSFAIMSATNLDKEFKVEVFENPTIAGRNDMSDDKLSNHTAERLDWMVPLCNNVQPEVHVFIPTVFAAIETSIIQDNDMDAMTETALQGGVIDSGSDFKGSFDVTPESTEPVNLSIVGVPPCRGLETLRMSEHLSSTGNESSRFCDVVPAESIGGENSSSVDANVKSRSSPSSIDKHDSDISHGEMNERCENRNQIVDTSNTVGESLVLPTEFVSDLKLFTSDEKSEEKKLSVMDRLRLQTEKKVQQEKVRTVSDPLVISSSSSKRQNNSDPLTGTNCSDVSISDITKDQNGTVCKTADFSADEERQSEIISDALSNKANSFPIVERKKISVMERLRLQAERKLKQVQELGHETTPEWKKVFSKVGAKNAHAAVIETQGAAPAKDATRGAFGENIIKGKNTGHVDDRKYDKTRNWQPRKSKTGSDNDSDSSSNHCNKGGQISFNASSAPVECGENSDSSSSTNEKTKINSTINAPSVPVQECGMPQKMPDSSSESSDEDDKIVESSTSQFQQSAPQKTQSSPGPFQRNSVGPSDPTERESDGTSKGYSVISTAVHAGQQLNVTMKNKSWLDDSDSDSDSSEEKQKAIRSSNIVPNRPSTTNTPFKPPANTTMSDSSSESDSSVPARPTIQNFTAATTANQAGTTRLNNHSDSDSSDDCKNGEKTLARPAMQLSTDNETKKGICGKSTGVILSNKNRPSRKLDSDSDSDSSDDSVPKQKESTGPISARISQPKKHDSDSESDSSDDLNKQLPKVSISNSMILSGEDEDSDSESSDDSSQKKAGFIGSTNTRAMLPKKQDSDSDSSDDRKSKKASNPVGKKSGSIVKSESDSSEGSASKTRTKPVLKQTSKHPRKIAEKYESSSSEESAPKKTNTKGSNKPNMKKSAKSKGSDSDSSDDIKPKTKRSIKAKKLNTRKSESSDESDSDSSSDSDRNIKKRTTSNTSKFVVKNGKVNTVGAVPGKSQPKFVVKNGKLIKVDKKK